MASTASGSQPPSLASTSATTSEVRPPAGPLPSKEPLVGEIGYQAISELPQGLQDVDLGDGPDVASTEGLNAAEADARNGRHPADRSNVNLASPSSTSLPIPGESQQTPGDSTTSLNTTSKHSIFSLSHSFHSFTSTRYKGVTLRTLTRFVILALIVCGLICAWALAAMRLKASSSDSSDSQNAGNSGTSTIFIHVAFAIIILILLIFVERSVFQLRAERYAHIHPGEVLPSHRHRTRAPTTTGGSGMAFAPWNRPPLPTYAAALGVRGTGDVEDSIIAAPPPPEYGNVRGSTLLLSSFLRRASNRSRASGQGGDAWQVVDRPRDAGRMSEISARSMPISYTEVEHQSDAERARILEEALAKLEDNHDNTRPSSETRS